MALIALPVVPSDRLTSVDAAGETLIFDAATQRYHVLNATSSVIWTAACSASSIEETAALATESLGQSITPEMVAEALAEFAEKGLIAGSTPPRTISRRSAVRTAAAIGTLALAASPAITTISAGTDDAKEY